MPERGHKPEIIVEEGGPRSLFDPARYIHCHPSSRIHPLSRRCTHIHGLPLVWRSWIQGCIYNHHSLKKSSAILPRSPHCFSSCSTETCCLHRRLSPAESHRNLMSRFGPEWGKAAQRWFARGIFVVSAFFSLWAGRVAVNSWGDWLSFQKGKSFNLEDPLFHNDVSFYVFRLPFLNMVYEFVLYSLLLTGACVIMLYIANRAIETWAGLPEISRTVRAQILCLLSRPLAGFWLLGYGWDGLIYLRPTTGCLQAQVM